VFELKTQSAHLLLSLQAMQTDPGFDFSICFANTSMIACKVFVMGFSMYHANLRKVALPLKFSSGV